MRFSVCLVSLAVLSVVTLQCLAAVEAEKEVRDARLQDKRAGGLKLTKVALKGLANSLRNNRSLITKALRLLGQYTSSSGTINEIIDVILTVSSRVDAIGFATSEFFVDVAVSLGLSRDFGLAVFNICMVLI